MKNRTCTKKGTGRIHFDSKIRSIQFKLIRQWRSLAGGKTLRSNTKRFGELTTNNLRVYYYLTLKQWMARNWPLIVPTPLRNYYKRYSHVLTEYCAQKNLAKIQNGKTGFKG